ncbi:helix-turn-helix domain-containing protein [bacterium]|nr:helix-turn-helix domain-containing protein [Akkermansiaceae bacterium]MDB4289183.1 helix-turn-helix domain-containing protein [bacterium]MDA7649279.1 helix-turn-helix domain-containing protein [Akkermansiaceae bacterium]MDA7863912.1 helix-turn-helix domain-containing protein [Akkermansiaceae bacterium]MDB0056271.1 helix-turn-helix domain-containing protein [Akkermansiaceae bacterium]
MSEWTDIGEQLKVTREKRKMSLEDISHEMRIPVATLRALEENDYSGFPSPSYAKRFLGQYAEFLNIDADDWLDCFETGNVLSHSENLDYLVPDNPEPRRPARPAKARSAQPNRKKETKESSGNFGQTVLIFLITGGLITGAVWGFLQIEKKITADDPIAEQEESSPSSLPENPASETPTPATVEETPIVLPPVAVIPGTPPGTPPFALTPGQVGPSGIEEPVFVQPEDNKPPPRAILVEED